MDWSLGSTRKGTSFDVLFLCSSPTNRRPQRAQRLLADYAPQVGGKASEGGLKGRLGGVVEIVCVSSRTAPPLRKGRLGGVVE